MSFYVLGDRKKKSNTDNFEPVLVVNLDVISIFGYCRVMYCTPLETAPEVCSRPAYTQK